MSAKVKLSLSTINQWSLDFEGNCRRIKESILTSRKNGAKYRLGPELEICGYGCEDHFYENDTIMHSWQVLAELLIMEETRNMICDVGMPVLHNNTRYNCRIIFLYKKILLIRPKLSCCNQGNYRELRWFTPWLKRKTTEMFMLPDIIREITNQTNVEIGDAVLQLKDTCIGSEICEELWTADSTHVSQSLEGVEIFTNASGSHFNLNKKEMRLQLAKTATSKVGGVYLYNNLIGCDGGRVYYDGTSSVHVNGDLIAESSQFSLKEVEVTVVTVDLMDVRSYRYLHRALMTSHTQTSSFRGENSSRGMSSSDAKVTSYPRVFIPEFGLCMSSDESLLNPVDKKIEFVPMSVEEEIEMGPACWLWDYLRRSGQSGFFLPLSGGIDSTSVACIVFSMCEMICNEMEKGNEQVIKDIRRILKDETYTFQSSEQLCGHLLTTCYMATENSSNETRSRAEKLAKRIGSTHISINIDRIITAFINVFVSITNCVPSFTRSKRENIALQNIQARSRMVMGYFLAQLYPYACNKSGSLLVLGSSNVDESLRGYYTKYDCSSADLNPIGGINKKDLRSFISYLIDKYKINELKSVINAAPTAELQPLKKGTVIQTDEEDMGMTYNELTVFGKLRKLSRCGPYSMFRKLLDSWKYFCSPSEVARKVRHFFHSYSINRHKATTITPSMHAENYGTDDNRFDLRPYLYPNWSWQFRKINEDVEKIERLKKEQLFRLS